MTSTVGGLVEEEQPPVDDGIAVLDGETPNRRAANIELAIYTALSAVIAGVTLYFFRGYQYGYSDHTLLSVKGIGWADPGAFRNDWFNNRAPQPHWLFDVVTYVGERSGHLPAVYFLYWTATLVAFGFGTALLAQYWLPANRRALAFAVPALMSVGPSFALGTFLPLDSMALPNLLGGCLAYATVAALITRRRQMACVLAVVTGLVHVQHGVVIAGVLILASLFDDVPWRRRVPYVATAGFLVVMSAVVSWARGLASGNSDMIDACRVASIGHCNANTWAWPVVRDGLFVVGLGAAVILLRRKDWRVLVPVLVVPAAIDVFGYLADRGDWGSLGEMAQRSFVYRFGMLLAPFVPWLVVLLAGQIERRVGVALLRTVAAGLECAQWLGSVYTRLGVAIVDPGTLHRVAFLLGALLCVPMLASTIAARTDLSALASRLASPVVAAITVTLVVGGIAGKGFAEFHPSWIHTGFAPNDGAVALGHELEARLPVGSILASPPDLEWVRLFSRRAVVGNCRAAPYGGEPWFEYKERLAALGVDTNRIYDCNRSGYAALTLDEIVDLHDRFGATHAAFLGSDPKVTEAQDAGWTLTWYSGPGTEPWWVFEIPER
jgi:hypothetical protein